MTPALLRRLEETGWVPGSCNPEQWAVAEIEIQKDTVRCTELALAEREDRIREMNAEIAELHEKLAERDAIIECNICRGCDHNTVKKLNNLTELVKQAVDEFNEPKYNEDDYYERMEAGADLLREYLKNNGKA